MQYPRLGQQSVISTPRPGGASGRSGCQKPEREGHLIGAMSFSFRFRCGPQAQNHVETSRESELLRDKRKMCTTSTPLGSDHLHNHYVVRFPGKRMTLRPPLAFLLMTVWVQ